MYLKTLAAALSLLAAPAFAADLEFQLINSSAANLEELYVSAAEADSWGDDILGMEVLAAGEQGVVTIPGGGDICVFDLQFVMDNGVTIEGTADLCATSEFTLTD